MKTQLPSEYPWKPSREPLAVRESQVENHSSKIIKMRPTPFVSICCWTDFFYDCKS